MAKGAGLSFTVVNNNLVNALKTDVGITPASNQITPPKQLEWLSQWDTGATNTVITKKVVNALGLKPVSMGVAHTPSGSYVAYKYYIGLYLPNRVAITKLLVMEGEQFGCDILIGMDVIGAGDFAVSNFEGKTTFTYRFPSFARIDFVKHSYLIPKVVRDAEDGPARNSRCSCGSGKKYKQCCGKNK